MQNDAGTPSEDTIVGFGCFSAASQLSVLALEVLL